MNEEFKYMNTCGHNSVDTVCPYKCPKSIPLYNVKVVDGGYVRDGKELVVHDESVEPESEPE